MQGVPAVETRGVLDYRKGVIRLFFPEPPMIGRLNHIGVATPSIEKSVAMYRDLMGATKIGEKFAMPEQGVWVCFVDCPNSQIELIEPIDEKSPIAGFLAKNPAGGQHHVCFEVPDIIAARDEGQGRDRAGRAAHRRPWYAHHLHPPQEYGRRAGRADGDAQGGASLNADRAGRGGG